MLQKTLVADTSLILYKFNPVTPIVPLSPLDKSNELLLKLSLSPSSLKVVDAAQIIYDITSLPKIHLSQFVRMS